ncbi:MAG: prohead protease [Desulfobulbaceae bacterium A2]|nr:MAG: prohead protease [Desulfobulbaceae bacterium A2]
MEYINAMELITTHLNADFDGLASMVAALRLYPEARLVFPGSQEKRLRDFLAQSLLQLHFVSLREIDPHQVSRLVLVDTRQAGRIGTLADCLHNPGLELHIYDHHPATPDDLDGQLCVVRELGATSTIFTQIFRERGLACSQEEATLLALGIYEDTGFFLHSTTTAEDLEAAAWLLRQGAGLDTIGQFVTRELNTIQVGLLSDLIRATTTYTIQDIEIAIASITLPDYVDDFSALAGHLMALENLNVLCVLACMGDRTYFIARSRIPEVNAGLLARELGGGGHAAAAAATIKDLTLIEAEEKLILLLHRFVRPRALAREIMSAPVISAPPELPIQEANRILTRYNITVLPVTAAPPVHQNGTTENDPVLGLISRRVTEKAIHHGLGHLPVSDYMSTEVANLSPEATLADIQELIIEHRQRLVPVVENNRLAGVITRTDLLNLLVNDPAHLPRNLLLERDLPSVERSRNLSDLLVEQLPRKTVVLLRTIGEVAEEQGQAAYAVGGFVRDLLLRSRNDDLDIVVEGDGIQLARRLADRLGGKARMHEKFRTATVILPGGFRLDVATARLEYYEYPAAMPTVELSSLKLDLFRRDFTINAMAIQLNPQRFGRLIDYFNCQNDLKERRIRVLHNLSFVEDPSRIFRAVRFEQRLDFLIARHTEKLLRNAVRMDLFGRFVGARFFNEIKYILSEDDPLPALRRLAEFDLFRFLWPDLRPHPRIDRRFLHLMGQAHRALSWFKLLYLDESCRPWVVYLLVIMHRSPTRELLNFCVRFEVSERMRRLLLGQKVAADRVARELLERPNIKTSEAYWLFEGLTNEGLLYLMATARKRLHQQAVSRYVTTQRQERPLLGGEDLLAAGYPRGPAYRTMLNHLLEAQLDGMVHGRDEALALLRAEYPLNAQKTDPNTPDRNHNSPWRKNESE